MSETKSNSAKPKVLHVLNSLQTGGIETQLTLLAPKLAGRYDMRVLTLREEGRLAETMREMGIEVECIPSRRKGWWAYAGDLALRIRRLRPDIVHAHSRYPALMGLSAAYLAGVPRRIAHYYSLDSRKSWPERRLRRERWLFHRSCNLAFCSEDVRDDILGLIPETNARPSHIVPCGVNRETFAPLDPARRQEQRAKAGIGPGDILIGIVARLDPLKNHPLLIEAAQILKRDFDRFKIWIIGPGADEDARRLRELIHQRDLDAHVEYRGFCPDLPSTMALFDIFTLCSKLEGMPLSVLEAWSCGLPVVATRVPGLRHLIQNERDGLLCQPGQPQALADALRRCAEDRDLRLEMGRRAFERSNEYSADAIARTTDSLYRSILAGAESDAAPALCWARTRAGWARLCDSGRTASANPEISPGEPRT